MISCLYSCSWLNDVNIYNTTNFDIEKIPLDSIANTKRWPLYLKLYHNADLQDAREVCKLFDELGIDHTQNDDHLIKLLFK
jgi:hypothetical protein